MIISQKEDTAGHAYMKRALQLSEFGGCNVSPNPFVGAVIVARGRIIGEGFHRRFGEAHAEVNAVNSVSEADRHLLREATMYVTLEPCSHFGKTPPCADLVVCSGIRKVVVAAEDPFLKDYESGIEKMRKAGITVEVGLLKSEALRINRRFFTAHTLKRPFVLLKWAMSSDGYMGGSDGCPVSLSSTFTKVLMHRERALYDAIMVGTDTILCDNPRLNCRLWPSRDAEQRPLKVTFDSPRLSGSSIIEKCGIVKMGRHESLEGFLQRLYRDYKIISLMVEGGAKTLESFLREGMFDEIRVETSPIMLGSGTPAPSVEEYARQKELHRLSPEIYGENSITYFVKNY